MEKGTRGSHQRLEQGAAWAGSTFFSPLPFEMETLVLRGTLKGHTGWVTSIATPLDANSNILVTASRDKSVILWDLTRGEDDYGKPRRALKGHSHFVQDVVISSDGQVRGRGWSDEAEEKENGEWNSGVCVLGRVRRRCGAPARPPARLLHSTQQLPVACRLLSPGPITGVAQQKGGEAAIHPQP